ncbi:GntR family transcriptional regulator [Halotalea alkalilenta]|uniref:GntR family transcriptional regulator n=1 Tax=Halotalea alkalilenta TaxID=376489 RepID=UPI000ABF3F3C|nr:GntR family transcriptional regulator [Halotalea alkalilenta]
MSGARHGFARELPAREPLAEQVYQRIKRMLFDFELMPGDRFSENDVAARMEVSRTPVREALHRLGREGYVEVQFKSGWQVRPFDFAYFEQLYDLRIVLECAAVERLTNLSDLPEMVDRLAEIWCVPRDQRRSDPQLAEVDKAFHIGLVEASGNAEMARVHRDVSEKISIIRRLDFTQLPRIEATYDEHGQILEALRRHRGEHAKRLLESHIEISKAEVRKITLHMLQAARERLRD